MCDTKPLTKSKSMTNLPPHVNLSISVVISDGKILVDWNPRWGCFTLPMTKIREWHTDRGHVDTDSETALDAAIRTVAESLGRPLVAGEIPQGPEELELQPYSHRSYRDGRWKRYGQTVFVFRIDSPVLGHRLNWLTPEDLETHRPISPTATEVIRHLQANEVL